MKNKHLWVGYLTLADKKKTLVASDDRVETGKSTTIYLYNQERDQIVEYNREIIAAKLKDAPEADYDAQTISDAYIKALQNKLPNLYRVIFTPNAGMRVTSNAKKADINNDDDDDIEIDDSFDMDDDDEDGDDFNDYEEEEEK